MKDSRVEKCTDCNDFCNYKPIDDLFEYLFNTTEQYFEYDIDSELSCIVDEYGALEELCDEYGITSNNCMAHSIKNYVNGQIRKAYNEGFADGMTQF